jgi:hypothetical protein
MCENQDLTVQTLLNVVVTSSSLVLESLLVDFDLTFLLNARIFLESQQTIWDVSYLLDTGLQTQGCTATFSSNAEVPEPRTMLLLGSGVLGLWGFRKKFKN